jgi:hypothetical protein
VTPIPVGVITETLPTNTPAPVTHGWTDEYPTADGHAGDAEAYEQEFTEFIAQFDEYGVSEADYRELVRRQLLREKVQEAIAAEQELAEEADHVSLYILQFATEEAANEAAAKIASDGYLPVWNEIGSLAAAADPRSRRRIRRMNCCGGRRMSWGISTARPSPKPPSPLP